MWDLPRSEIEPTSPTLAGRFLTTEPPGKPCIFFTFFTFPNPSQIIRKKKYKFFCKKESARIMPVSPRGSHLFIHQAAGSGTTGLKKVQLLLSERGLLHLNFFYLQHLAKYWEVICSLDLLADRLCVSSVIK